MLVWAIASQKGGVGKTTTVASLAGWMQREHLRTLMIDTDPHASLTTYRGLQEENLTHNLFELYSDRELTREKVLGAITPTRFQGLDILASSMTLATIDRQLSGRTGVGRILSKALRMIDDSYDIVLIDCPPVLGALMVNALVASTYVLVPTQTEFLSLKSLEGMVRTFNIMQNADKGCRFNYIIVPTMYDKRTKASTSSLAFLKENYQKRLWGEVIPVDTLFRESSQMSVPAPIMDGGTRGSKAYRELFLHLVGCEMDVHPDLVSPATAATLMPDDGEGKDSEVVDATKGHNRMVEDQVAAMMSPEEPGEGSEA